MVVDWDDASQNIDVRVFASGSVFGCSYDGGGGCVLMGSAETGNKPETLVLDPPPANPNGFEVIIRNLGSGQATVTYTITVG